MRLSLSSIALSLLLSACTCQPRVDPDVPEGRWVLRGDGATGSLQIEGGACLIGLWGPSWASAGLVADPAALVPCEAEQRVDVEGEPDGSWVFFPFVTGAGEAIAALRIDGDQAIFPLGAREGEFDLALSMSSGALSDPERAALAAASEAGIEREAAIWDAGAFRILDRGGLDGSEEEGRLVGEAWFGEGLKTTIAFYDLYWMTEGPVEPQEAWDGPDRVLIFPVEPSFHSQEGRIRINTLTRQIVVPTGSVPSPADRRLTLAPGAVDPEAARAAMARAQGDAIAREKRIAPDLARGLAEELGAAGCTGEVPEEWAVWVVGYDVIVETDEDGACVVGLEPEPVQHTRRVAVRADASALRGLLVRGVE